MTDTVSTIRPEQQQDLIIKLEALGDAVTAARETFRRRIGAEFETVGTPCAPDCDEVTYGATIALTGEAANFTYAVTCDNNTADWLTRCFFDMGPEEDTALADLADAMNEIPNVAAGRWKARRSEHGEKYQLGLPMFMSGRSWLRFCSKGVNTLSQRLVGPEGVALQVVLVWQSGTKSGRFHSMTTESNAAAGATTSLPVNVLQEATDAVVNTCDIQMGLSLEVEANLSDLREAEIDFGSSIALTTEQGSGWNLAVMGDKASCEKLTRILFAMEDDEQPAMEDLADGISEITSVAAGVFKAGRLEAGERVRLGLPLFIEGRGCIDFFGSGLQGLSRSLNGPGGIVVHVVLIWQEGRPTPCRGSREPSRSRS